jgi:signal transduction histidine kinase
LPPKRFDVIARLGGALNTDAKIAATLACLAAPAVIMWFALADEKSKDIAFIEREREGVRVLRFLDGAEAASARFVRLGGFESDKAVISDAISYTGVAARFANSEPAMARGLARAIASLEEVRDAESDSARAEANRRAGQALNWLSQAIGAESGISFDADPDLRLPLELRNDRAREFAFHLALMGQAAERGWRRNAETASLLGALEDDRESLRELSRRAVDALAAEANAPTLGIELERFDDALARLIAITPEVRNGRDIAFLRAMRDASAALETLERSALDAVDASLAERQATLERDRAARLLCAALLILAFLSLGYLFARRALAAPLRQLVETTAALSTGQTDIEIAQQERGDEIGEIARYLAASNTFIAARIDAQAGQRSAERALKAQSHFLTAMTHELRTPLNAIIGYGEMLLEDAEAHGADEAKDLAQLLGSAHHLLGLVSDVIDLSIIANGDLELHTTTFDPLELMKSTACKSQALADANHTTIEIAELRPMAPFRGDPARLGQCLHNLISNAAKFTKQGSVNVRAEQYVRDGRRALRFVVTDTGCGIKQSQLPRLFDAFSQGANGFSRSHDGMGLGLALTQKLARAMGGDVSVQSELGKGSAFTLWVVEAADESAKSPALAGAAC